MSWTVTFVTAKGSFEGQVIAESPMAWVRSTTVWEGRGKQLTSHPSKEIFTLHPLKIVKTNMHNVPKKLCPHILKNYYCHPSQISHRTCAEKSHHWELPPHLQHLFSTKSNTISKNRWESERIALVRLFSARGESVHFTVGLGCAFGLWAYAPVVSRGPGVMSSLKGKYNIIAPVL